MLSISIGAPRAMVHVRVLSVLVNKVSVTVLVGMLVQFARVPGESPEQVNDPMSVETNNCGSSMLFNTKRPMKRLSFRTPIRSKPSGVEELAVLPKSWPF